MVLLDARGHMMSSFDALKIAIRPEVAGWTAKDQINIACFLEGGLKRLREAGFTAATDGVKGEALQMIDSIAPRGSMGVVTTLRWAIEEEPTEVVICTNGELDDGEALLDTLKQWVAIRPGLKVKIVSVAGKEETAATFLRRVGEETGARVVDGLR